MPSEEEAVDAQGMPSAEEAVAAQAYVVETLGTFHTSLDV
jgi:hypothetical protein